MYSCISKVQFSQTKAINECNSNFSCCVFTVSPGLVLRCLYGLLALLLLLFFFTLKKCLFLGPLTSLWQLLDGQYGRKKEGRQVAEVRRLWIEPKKATLNTVASACGNHLYCHVTRKQLLKETNCTGFYLKVYN